MNLDYWKKTGSFKPFTSVEEFEAFEKDLMENPYVQVKKPAAVGHSIVKKGFGSNGNHYDSLSEFIVFTYMNLVEHTILTRNEKERFLLYTKPDGKQGKFYPDFYCGDLFFEVKGRYTDKDIAKHDQHPEVRWFFQPDIAAMKKVLNEKFPDWKKDFTQTNVTAI